MRILSPTVAPTPTPTTTPTAMTPRSSARAAATINPTATAVRSILVPALNCITPPYREAANGEAGGEDSNLRKLSQFTVAREQWSLIVHGGRDRLLVLSRCGTHQQLARPDKAIRAVELGERLSNLLPGRFATGLVEACQHLVQGAVGFLLQP